MDEILTIEEAAAWMSTQANEPITKGGIARLIMAGAEGRIPIHWRNSLQKGSILFSFTGEVPKSHRFARFMQVSHFELGKLEACDSIRVSLFEPNGDDWQLLEDAESLDADGNLDGFRAIAEGGGVTVTHDMLFVRKADLLQLIGDLKLTTPASELVTPIKVPSVRHKLRKNSLDVSIKKAIKKAESIETGAVYLELRALALDCEPPFTGAFDGAALLYTKDDNKTVAKLTKNALGKRLKNHNL